MEQTSQREIRAIDPTWTIADITARLAKTLAGAGPALTLTPITSQTVPSEIALVVSTSGSTGVAKEVGLSASALVASAKATNKFLGANGGQSWSLLLPLTHIAGINVLARSLELGTTPVDARDISGSYPKADFTAIVPTQLFRALNGETELLEHLQSAKSVLVGGAALDITLRDQASAAGIKIVESYGMTETCGGCIYDGQPIGDTSVEIDENGLIKIATSSLATTYLNDEAGWSSKMAGKFFTTSDLGEIVNGKLKVMGRADDIIISGGENVSLKQVEDLLNKEFTGINCAAFAIKDSLWGQALHLAIAGSLKPELAKVNEYLASQISVAAKVKGIIYIDHLPLTSLDKIDRQQLIAIAEREGGKGL
jgi:O-succinylbenzoic acid--CoA ligase